MIRSRVTAENAMRVAMAVRERPQRRSEIQQALGLSEMAVRYALSELVAEGCLARLPSSRYRFVSLPTVAPKAKPKPAPKPAPAPVRQPDPVQRERDSNATRERTERERTLRYLGWAPPEGWTARELLARLYPTTGAMAVRFGGAAVPVDGLLRRLDDLRDAGLVERDGERWRRTGVGRG